LRDQYARDDDFIAEAKKWYAEKRPQLRLNEKYPYLPGLPANRLVDEGHRDLWISSQ